MDVDEVADLLYALEPEQFTTARNARARAAKAAGDKDSAARIAALRKPTTVAWLANSLARQRPDEVAALLDLGEALREATATLSGPELRELSRQRHRVVYALVQEAKALAAETGRRVTDDAARDLEATLAAALTNADDAHRLRRSRLTEGLAPGGFAGPQPTTAAPVRSASPAPAPSRARRPSPEEHRLAQQRERLGRDLQAAQAQARDAGAAHGETAAAFDNAQRALTEAELVLADLRAELSRAMQARDQAQRDSDRTEAAHESASRKAQQADERVADLQKKLMSARH